MAESTTQSEKTESPTVVCRLPSARLRPFRTASTITIGLVALLFEVAHVGDERQRFLIWCLASATMLYTHLRWKRAIRHGYRIRIFADRVEIAWGKPAVSVAYDEVARIVGNGPDRCLILRDDRVVPCPKPPGFEAAHDALEANLAPRLQPGREPPIP